MKKLKKTMAVVLAVMVALTMGIATSSMAFADGDPSYSITVSNDNSAMSIVGKTYTAYKLFDLKYSGSNYSYTIKTDNPFYSTAAAKAVLDTYFDFADTSDATVKTVTVKTAKQDADTKTLTAADVRALADALQPYATGAGAGSETAASESVTINLSEPGYYIVTGTVKPTDPANSDKEVVSAVILDNTDPDATVQPKAGVPTLDKKITGEHTLDAAGKAATAEVGKTVSFQLDSIVPDLTGYDDYTFIISDEMTNGLTFTDPEGTATNDVVVKINDVDKTSNVTVNVSGQKLTVTIPYNVLSAATKGQAITVTYSAVVNSNALTTDYEKNTASLEYSNNPYDDSTNKTPDKEVYVIDVDLNVDKISSDGVGTKLKDAKFKVFKGSTQPADGENAWYKWDKTNNEVTWVTKADADVFVTGTDGKFNPSVQGLEAGKTGTAYGLLETEAPEGYNLLSAPVIVTLTGAYSGTNNTATVTADGASVTNGTVNLGEAQNSNQPVAVATIKNNTGAELPSTGGIGTTIFYILGALLVIGCGIILIARRRMNNA